MTQQEWGIVVGMAVLAVIALAPWIVAVHAMFAVINTRLEDIEDRIEERERTKTDSTPQGD